MILKRPFAFFGLTVLTSSFLCFQLESFLFAALFCLLSFISGVLLIVFGKNRIRLFVCGTALIFAFLSSVSYLITDSLLLSPSEKEIGENKNISAIIYDYPVKKGDRYYVDCKIKGKFSPVLLNCRLVFSKEYYYLYLEDTSPGDEFSFFGTVYKSGNDIDKYEDNFRSLCKVISAYPTGFVSVRESVKKVPFSRFKDLRQSIKAFFLENYDSKYSGIAIASLLGDRSYLDPSIYDSMKKSGIAHIFAVSGLHLSIWVLYFDRLLRLLGFDKKRYNFILIAFVLSAMLLVGFTPSICRAGVTLILYLLFDSFYRKGDSLNTLGIAAVLILLVRPSLSINTGFLLSLFATVGILGFSVPICGIIREKLFCHTEKVWLQKLLITLCSIPIISFGAWFFSMPVSALFFGEVSLLSVLTNVLVYIFEAPMIICLGVSASFHSLPFVGDLTSFVSRISSDAVIRISNAVSAIPFSFFTLQGVTKISFSLLYAGSVSCVSLSYKYRNSKVLLLGLSIIFVLLVFFNLTLLS